MEAKFFSEIEKNMNIKTIKDFKKESRKKINDDLEKKRKNNDDLDRILNSGESELWSNIINGLYSWLQLDSNENKKLFRLINIYSLSNGLVDIVKDLNTKVEEVKQLKDSPVDSD